MERCFHSWSVASFNFGLVVESHTAISGKSGITILGHDKLDVYSAAIGLSPEDNEDRGDFFLVSSILSGTSRRVHGSLSFFRTAG